MQDGIQNYKNEKKIHSRIRSQWPTKDCLPHLFHGFRTVSLIYFMVSEIDTLTKFR